MYYVKLLYLCGFMLFLTSCGSKTNYPQPPLYSSVDNYQIERTFLGQRIAESIVEFDTSDPEPEVHSFFTNQLIRDGWEVRSKKTDYTGFYYRGPEHNYGLGLYTTTTANGLTHVKIRFGYSGPGLSFPDEYTFPTGY